jgi:hypothetical protein
MTTESKHFISIWFFIGSLLLVYGILILGASIFSVYNPPEHQVVLAELHAGIWMGALLIIIGSLYCYLFYPGKSRK